VVLCSLLRVVQSVRMMAVSRVRVVRRGLVAAGFVVFSRLLMVFGRLRVMLGSFVMVFRSFLRHGHSFLRR